MKNVFTIDALVKALTYRKATITVAFWFVII